MAILYKIYLCSFYLQRCKVQGKSIINFCKLDKFSQYGHKATVKLSQKLIIQSRQYKNNVQFYILAYFPNSDIVLRFALSHIIVESKMVIIDSYTTIAATKLLDVF